MAYDREVKERLRAEKQAALAKKKRWFGTDLLIDSLNQQSLKLFGVKVGIAHDPPDPGHLGMYGLSGMRCAYDIYPGVCRGV